MSVFCFLCITFLFFLLECTNKLSFCHLFHRFSVTMEPHCSFKASKNLLKNINCHHHNANDRFGFNLFWTANSKDWQESCRSLYYNSRCKDSANRVKYQKKITFSLYFRDAAYLRDICLKDNGKFRLSEKNTYNNAFLSARNLSKSFTHPILCYFLRTHKSINLYNP